MKKWDIYSCYCISWWWDIINQWNFEIITLTEKTCKIKQTEKWYFDYVSRFMKDKEKREITFRWDMKKYIKEEFIRYDTGSWMPFVFTLNKAETKEK